MFHHRSLPFRTQSSTLHIREDQRRNATTSRYGSHGQPSSSSSSQIDEFPVRGQIEASGKSAHESQAEAPLSKAYRSLHLSPDSNVKRKFILLARNHVFDTFHCSRLPLQNEGHPQALYRRILVREITGTFMRRCGQYIWPPITALDEAPWLVDRGLQSQRDGTCWRGETRGLNLDAKGAPLLGEVSNEDGSFHGYVPLIEGEMASELCGVEDVVPPAKGTFDDFVLSELGWRLQAFFDALVQAPALKGIYINVLEDLGSLIGERWGVNGMYG